MEAVVRFSYVSQCGPHLQVEPSTLPWGGALLSAMKC
uniref:Uncharacterized protein n=1 Tax=Anguilla anguilla TaxID=7936 RepID=A0A0E9QT37_ANGAN